MDNIDNIKWIMDIIRIFIDFLTPNLFSGFVGAILGAVIGYYGNAKGAEKANQLVRKQHIDNLTGQIEYLIELEKRARNVSDEVERSQERIDSLTWWKDTLIWGDYKTDICYAPLKFEEKQNLLKWFSLWEQFIKEYFSPNSYKVVGAYVLANDNGLKEDMDRLSPKVDDIAKRLKKRRNG